MARIYFIIISVACVFNLANCLTAPFPGFTPCKINDDKCLLQNTENGVKYFADGIPELGVERLDPGYFDKVDAGSQNLKFLLNNVTVKGLNTCIPLKVKHDQAKSTLLLQLQCAMEIDGHYEMDGQVLILKISGSGKVHVILPKIISTIDIKYVIKKGKDDKKHIRIKSFNHSYEIKEKSDVQFSGLFDDNAILMQAAQDLIKNSGNEVIQEIGGKMTTASVTRTVENMNRFFGKMDYDEITLP